MPPVLPVFAFPDSLCILSGTERTFPLDFSGIRGKRPGFQILACPAIPVLCFPKRILPDCKKTRSSRKSSGRLSAPAKAFRSPACHSLNTCWDSFCNNRCCLDFGIRFQAFASFGVRYTVGSLDSAKYFRISSSICCSTSDSIHASQFFFFRTESCNSASANISARTSSWDVLCFRFVSFNLIDFTYFAI